MGWTARGLMLIPMAEQSRRRSAATCLLGLWVQIRRGRECLFVLCSTVRTNSKSQDNQDKEVWIKKERTKKEIPIGAGEFFFSKTFRWLWVPPSLLCNGYWVSLLGGRRKWPDHEVNHSPTCSAEVALYSFMDWAHGHSLFGVFCIMLRQCC